MPTTTQSPSGLLARVRGAVDLLYRELIKFGVVGAIAFVVDMGTFNLLRSTVLPHKVTTATIISAAIATLVAWVGNRWWTFRHRVNRPVAHEVGLFFGTNAVAMLIQVGVVAFSHYVLQLQSITFDNAAKIVGIGLGTLFRFWAYRTYVFAGEVAGQDLGSALGEEEREDRGAR